MQTDHGPYFPKPFWMVLRVPNSPSVGFLQKDGTFDCQEDLLQFGRVTFWSFLEVRDNCVRTEPGSATAGQHLSLLIWWLRHLVPGWGTKKADPSCCCKVKAFGSSSPLPEADPPPWGSSCIPEKTGPDAGEAACWIAWAWGGWILGQRQRQQMKAPAFRSQHNPRRLLFKAWGMLAWRACPREELPPSGFALSGHPFQAPSFPFLLLAPRAKRAQ